MRKRGIHFTVLVSMRKWLGRTLTARGIGSYTSPSTLSQELPMGWIIISEVVNFLLGSWKEDWTVLDHLKVWDTINFFCQDNWLFYFILPMLNEAALPDVAGPQREEKGLVVMGCMSEGKTESNNVESTMGPLRMSLNIISQRGQLANSYIVTLLCTVCMGQWRNTIQYWIGCFCHMTIPVASGATAFLVTKFCTRRFTSTARLCSPPFIRHPHMYNMVHRPPL